jgi:hypothetical protein
MVPEYPTKLTTLTKLTLVCHHIAKVIMIANSRVLGYLNFGDMVAYK